MPRTADAGLERRIVKTAQKLWHERGEKGLTLRAIARAAGTTTTTVYKRFRDKEQIRLALAQQVQQRIAKVVAGSVTIEDAYRRYVRFAKTHPREYKLLFGPAWIQLVAKGRPRPSKEWLQSQLATRFGGGSEDYELFFYAVFLLTHGAASLLAGSPQSQTNQEAEENCIAICDLLLKNIEIFRKAKLKR